MFAHEAKKLGLIPFKFRRPHPRNTLKNGISMYLYDNRDYLLYDNDLLCSIQLYKKNPKYEIGHVDLIKIGNNRAETHSKIHKDLQGHGIGCFLYYQIICWGLYNNYRVSSSDGPSEDASKTWARLRSYFYIRYLRKEHRHYVMGKK